MRLICPNCGAQYEVPIEVIPNGGRDVQCSNCGHTWYQRHPDDDPELAEELNVPVPDTEWEPEPEPETPPLRRSSPEVVVNNEVPPPPPAPEPEYDPEPEPEVPPRETMPQARSLDPSVAEVLREEAELERRRRDAEALESQPDLGLTQPDEDEMARRSRQSRERMLRMRGEDLETDGIQSGTDKVATAAAAAAAAGSRRDLLPDVEEINQTLRSTAEPRAPAREAAEPDAMPRPTKKKSGGFGGGFIIVILLAAIAVGLYVFAPQISESLPPAAPYLDLYVAQVEAGRVWLDAQVQSLLQTLDAMSSEAAIPPAEDSSESATGN